MSTNVLPALVSKLSMPKVLWYQTNTSVVLRIMLPGVDDYFLRADEDHVRFSTSIGERDYYICIYYFGAVIPDKCTHRNKGREVTVQLPKAHRGVDWPRLSIDKTKNPQITSDPDRLPSQEERVLDTTEFKANLREYKRLNNIKQILPDGRSSSEAESDDEAMDVLFE